MQIDRYKAVIRYISEYKYMYIREKLSQMIPFNVKIKRFFNFPSN